MYLLKLKYLTESYKLVLYVCSLKLISNMKKTFFLFVILYSSITFCQNKGKEYTIRTVAFYNLENLFDTINDVTKNDEASPMMELKENRSKVYWVWVRYLYWSMICVCRRVSAYTERVS